MSGKTVFVFASKYLGVGEDELGEILIRGMFRTLTKVAEKPDILIFLNSGVELLIKPDILENLELIMKSGGRILACGTCLEYYNLKDQIQSDQISNMHEILTTITNAKKVVNF